jgi:hypothetical protein
MRKSLIAIVALLVSAPAAADISRVVSPSGQKIALNTAYRKGNEVRVYASSGGHHVPRDLMRAAVVRMAELTKARGLPRFAVTKISDCGTLMMNGSIQVSTSCRLLGRMLNERETAHPEGKGEITYFRTDDVLAGNLAPEIPGTIGL